jgi:isopentenyl diphosphate isomerase/L-lactate dehydrogenase-like FMN-dependent dehydrogenase
MSQLKPNPSSGQQRQMQIYLEGTQGKKPAFPVSFEELVQRAREKLPPEAFDYLAGSAGSEDTCRANLDAFKGWRLVPRFLRDVGQRDLSVELFGQRFPAPFLLAPVGVQSILHDEAELAVARAARSTGVGMILSTVSSFPLEQVAEALGDSPHWFQLYRPNNHEITASFLARAERAGFSALVVTLDTFLLAWRERDIRHAYLPFLYGKGLANYFSDPVFRSLLTAPPEEDPRQAVEQFSRIYSSPSFTWNDLAFLREKTKLPILLKGILSVADAVEAADHGVDGIIVSNHGGRQLDGAVASLDVLPGIAEAVGEKLTVLFDSGIRRGTDILKALSLGARAVLLGRPYCYGLSVNGEQGVRDVILNLLTDLDLSLANLGSDEVSLLAREHPVTWEGPIFGREA